MTSFSEPAWRRPASADDHSQLLAWEAELAAERAPLDQCDGCYDPATGEFGPGYPCAHCRARELAEVDSDGHDDKTVTVTELLGPIKSEQSQGAA